MGSWRTLGTRVRATSVQPYDWHHLRGEPYAARLMPGTLGLRGPKPSILGADLAGQVEVVGAGVTGFQPGDAPDVIGCAENESNLVALTRLIEDGTLVPVIDRSYPFEQLPAAPMRIRSTHIDMATADRDTEVARLVGLGATRVADMNEWGYEWTVLQDPEGNEFCVAQTR